MRNALILLSVLVLAAFPVLADDTGGSTVIQSESMAANIESEDSQPALAQMTGLQTANSEVASSETASILPNIETAIDFETLRLLGVNSPLDVNFYGDGYCYHDCSRCQDRSDCIEPGFHFGFPCTRIPLC